MIDLNLSEEQKQIIESLGSLLSEHFPVPFLRDDAGDKAARGYRALADFGAFSIALPQERGGAGLTVAEEVLLHIEFGRHLVSPSAIAASLGVRLAASHGEAAIAAKIASGARRICLGTGVRSSRWGAAEGMTIHLHDMKDAEFALIWHAGGFALLKTDRFTLDELAATDRSVRLSRFVLNDQAIIQRSYVKEPLLNATGHLLVCAQLLGVAEASRDMAAAYAGVREQFGQPIGSFQAIKHRCANMAIHATVLRAQLLMAILALRDGWPDADFHAEACRVLGTRYALENARSNIQVHGGIGFSAECSAHLYLLRAHLLENVGVTRGDLLASFAARPPFAFAGKQLARQEIISCG